MSGRAVVAAFQRKAPPKCGSQPDRGDRSGNCQIHVRLNSTKKTAIHCGQSGKTMWRRVWADGAVLEALSFWLQRRPPSHINALSVPIQEWIHVQSFGRGRRLERAS